jgi:hypothetical protein
MKLRKVIQDSLCLLLSVAIALYPISVQAASGATNTESFESHMRRAIAAYDAVTEMSEQIRDKLGRTAFDVEALVDHLDYDIEKAVSYVQTEISYEPYKGVLRGAAGTLRSRAGNSIDQSILLAAMLNTSGVETRILEVKQTAALRNSLVKAIRVVPPSTIESSVNAEVEGTLANTLDKFGFNRRLLAELRSSAKQTGSTLHNELMLDASERSARLTELLSESGVPLKDNNLSTIVRDLESYFAVQFRKAAGDPWRTVHPALGDSAAEGDVLEPIRVFSSQVPEDLLHKLRIEMFAFKRTDDQVSREALFDRWERPVANLNDSAISMSIVPLTDPLLAKPPKPGPRSLTNQIFAVMFNGKPMPQGFDLLGNLVPVGDGSSAAAQLFATNSERLNRAAAAISGAASKHARKHATSLFAIRLRVSTIDPGGKVISNWRSVFESEPGVDLFEDAEQYERAYQHITGLYSIHASGERTNARTLVDNYLSVIQAARPILLASVALKYNQENVARKYLTKGASIPTPWPFHGFQRAIFESFSSNRLAYFHRPAVQIHRLRDSVAERPAEEQFDIVSFPYRVLSESLDSVDMDQTITQGVWATLTESLLFSMDNNASTRSAADTIADAQKAGMSNISLAGEAGKIKLASLLASAAVRTRILGELQAGNVVVVPVSKTDRTVGAAWWRTDPKTGETYGVIETGEGHAGTEYTMGHVIAIGTARVAAYFIIRMFVFMFCAIGRSIGPAMMYAGLPDPNREEREREMVESCMQFSQVSGVVAMVLIPGPQVAAAISSVIAVIFSVYVI